MGLKNILTAVLRLDTTQFKNKTKESKRELDGVGKSNSIRIIEFAILKLVVNTLEGGRLTKEQPSPFGLGHLIQASVCFLLPVGFRHSTVMHCGVYVPVWLGHLFKACMIDDEVRA